MCQTLLLHQAADAPIASRLRSDLQLRRLPSSAAEFGTAAADPWNWPGKPTVVALIPPRGRHTARTDALHTLAELVGRGLMPIVVVPDGIRLDRRFTGLCYEVVRSEHLSYDELFERLFEILTRPRPSWLTARVRPSHFSFPVGVSWWDDSMALADDATDRIVRLEETASAVLWPGLSEPHHIKLDRFKLLAADKGRNRVVIGKVNDGRMGTVRMITKAAGVRLDNPAGVDAAHGLVAIADTDRHRVVVTHDDIWRSRSLEVNARWIELPSMFKMPCGVTIETETWVCDTFSHRLVAFAHDGRLLGSYVTGEVAYPVHSTSWGPYLFVAQEDGVVVFRRAADPAAAGGFTLERVTTLAPELITAPFALSVNRQGRMAVSDRAARCVWIVDLGDLRRELESR